MQLKPSQLLGKDFAALFMRYLVKEKGIKEINVKKLEDYARRFAARMQRYAGDANVVKAEDIISIIVEQGWIEPTAANTFTVRDW